MNTYQVVILLVCGSLATVYSASSVSSYLQLCHQSNPDLAGCIKNSINSAVAKLASSGIPEIGLAKIDPFSVPSINIKDKNFQIALSNVNIVGMSKFTINSATLDKAKNAMKFTFTIPSIQLSGKYNMDVTIINTPLKGSGDTKMSFTNIASSLSAEAEKFTSGGKTYYRIKTLSWSVTPATANFSFSSLGEATNKFLNTNWKVAYATFRNIPEAAFSNLVKDIVNKFLAKYPVDELFPA